MARMVIDGFGQVELNNVAFRRDGRIEAQCALDPAVFTNNVPCENGMILRVKKAEHKITFADASAENQLYALNYSSEHMYDERKPGLKNFSLSAHKNAKGQDFYPRVGYLAVGDLWTTNCIDLGSYADAAAVKTALDAGTVVYASVGTEGAVVLGTSAPSVGPVIQVIKKTTMPDGQDAFQLQVLAI
jgi:hypothetical protein